MHKKVVIVGSASLADRITYWKTVWESAGHVVTAMPVQIPQDAFLASYPRIHTDFFRHITEADILFVMNEDRHDIPGYLGAESFAEMGFGVAHNLLHDTRISILLLAMPDPRVQSYNEVDLWLRLGWISLYQDASLTS